MACLCEGTWRCLVALKEALTCSSTTEDDQPFAQSSNLSTTSSNIVLDDRVIEADLGTTNVAFEHDDSFTTAVLENSSSPASWRPQLRLHDSPAADPHTDSGHWTTVSGQGPGVFEDVDLGNGPRLTDSSRSTTRESGYGRSLHDSHSSSSPTEPAVTLHQHHTSPSPGSGVFKVVMQDEKRCWFVLRCYGEFEALHRIILQKVGDVSLQLPSQDDATRYSLDNFVQAVMVNPRTVCMPEVREFLQLDRFRDTSSSDSSTSSSSSSSNPQVLLNPRLLMVPGAPALARKPFIAKTAREQDAAASDHLLDEESIELGCTEKKALKPSDFEFLNVVGKGSFGKVMVARYKEDNKVYAVKVLSKKVIIRRNETAHVLSERSVLIKMLNHPYLVQLHFAFTTTHKIFFVLDYVNGGELFFHLQRERVFTEARAKFYAAEICCALAYMHTKGIVYRDLKPENILLDAEGHIVLTDFGLCKEGLQNPTSRTATFCGTPEYLAPEILKKQPYTRAVDWWTLGAVLYEMLYGLPPFYSRDTPTMYTAILNKPLKLKNSVSVRGRSLLMGLLQKDPQDRLGSGPRDGQDVKDHEFFRSVSWNLVNNRALTPPFVPVVKSETCTRNVDPMFTKETISIHSPASPSFSASVQAADNAFIGFSYAPPLQIDAS